MSVSMVFLIGAVVLFLLGAFGVEPDMMLYVGLASFAAGHLPLGNVGR